MVNLPQAWYAARMQYTLFSALVYPDHRRPLARTMFFYLVDMCALVLGGFFHELGPAQMLYLSVTSLGFAEYFKPAAQRAPVTPVAVAIGTAVGYAILRWGGFY
jgi:hypothetical protein